MIPLPVGEVPSSIIQQSRMGASSFLLAFVGSTVLLHRRADGLLPFVVSPLSQRGHGISGNQLVQNSHSRPKSSSRLHVSNNNIPADENAGDAFFADYVNDENDGSTGAAPRKESYTAEATVAQQANDLLLQTAASNHNVVELQNELSNSFLQYALSIIMGRAIPDARDGLKPVHRRILFAMHELQLSANSSHRKCARVVGDVLGKLHPHGDTAVYDALVRLAQDFTTNHPLIDGHGNFGSIDADPAAAMRYTECRLTPLSQTALLSDLGEDTVDRIPTFDGTGSEPVVLPAQVPVLLVNGASGIAVGMATNIPPHNLREILSACASFSKARMEGTTVATETLLKIVPGPDFPTGAHMMGTDGARQLYTQGNGGVVLRAVSTVEPVAKNRKSSRMAIIVTELPYQVNKAALLEKIAALVNEKKLEGIADLRDESSGREGIRVVIELKRDAVATVVLANLYQKTPLQTSFAGNLLALMTPNGTGTGLVPQRFTLRQALDCFLDFRFATIRRKTQYQLTKVEGRMHILEGLLLALEKIDQVIAVVRAAPDSGSAKRELSEQLLGTSEKQTDAILRLQLGQLTRLNKGKLDKEMSELLIQQKEFRLLLDDDNAVYSSMIASFDVLSKKFGIDRRTIIHENGGGEQKLDATSLIRNSRSVVIVTRSGYIKRMPLKTFTSQNRGTRGMRGTAASDSSADSEVQHCFTCNDHDTLIMVTNSGVAYGLPAYQVPQTSRTARGQPFPSVLQQLRPSDEVTAILPVSEFSDKEYLVLVTEQGWIKKTPLTAFDKLGNRRLIAAKLTPGDQLVWCQRCSDQDDVLVGTCKGMATRFAADKMRPTGRASRGVRSMKLKEGDSIADVNILRKDNEGSKHVLAITKEGYGKRVLTTSFRTQLRGGTGVLALKFKSNVADGDSMSCLRQVTDDDEILLTTEKGIIVRLRAADIPSQARTATGVLIQRLDPGDKISNVSVVPDYEEVDVQP